MESYEVLFALDTSASTSSMASYWQRVNEKYLQYKSSKTLYVAWDKTSKVITDKIVEKEIKSKGTISGPDTKPDSLARLIVEKNFTGKLVLITDGQIEESSVVATENALNGWNFSEVDIELIGKNIDLSVTSPFTRSTKFEINMNGVKLAGGSSSTKVDLSKYSTVDKFIDGYEDLYGVVVVQNMGKLNSTLRDDLLKLQKSLLAECAEKNKVEIAGTTPVMASLKAGDYDAAISLTKSINKVFEGNSLPTEISGKIQKLIQACTSVGVYSVSLLTNSRVQRADDAKVVESEQIEALDTTDEKFECPIFYENDTPALLISSVLPILEGESKQFIDLVCTCPLYLLTVPHLVEKVVASIDHPIGCFSIKFSNGVFEESPFTRKPILGAIPLGLDKTHVKAGNWTISRLFTGGKMIGNIQLWYTVLYYIIKDNVKYLSDNHDFMKSLQSHLGFRLENYTSYMGLSGLPEYPLVKVPVSQAIWYCVASGDIYCEDKMEQDRLRSFYSIAKYLLGILDLLNYPYKNEFTANRLKILQAWNYLMANKFEMNEIKSLIRAQYQNHMYLESLKTYIFLDGSNAEGSKTPPALPAQLSTLSLQELIYLSGKVSIHEKVNSVLIPRTLPINNDEQPKISFNYCYQNDYQPYPVIICPATLRPYSQDRKKNIPWEESAKQVFGDLDKMLSMSRYYLAYIETNNEFPTRDKFFVFIQAKQKNMQVNRKDTLPISLEKIFINIDIFFKKSFDELSKHLNRPITATDVGKRGQLSSNRGEREKIEKEWLNGTYSKV